MSSVLPKISAIIADKLGVEAASVKPTDHFVDDLGADSLDTAEMILEFEKAFDISIPDEAASEIQTVAEAIKYIEKQMAHK